MHTGRPIKQIDVYSDMCFDIQVLDASIGAGTPHNNPPLHVALHLPCYAMLSMLCYAPAG